MSHQFIKLIIFSVQRLKAVSFLAWKWSLMELLIGHQARKGNLIWPSKSRSRILLLPASPSDPTETQTQRMVITEF